MKEIKFRALGMKGTVYESEWKYGQLTFDGEHTLIWQKEGYPVLVNPESIGEYIGLKNKNGREEYHKDILDGGGLGHLVIEYGFYDNGDLYENKDSGFGWYLKSLKDNEVYGITYIDLYKKPIIGNIYENPELLKDK